MWWRKRLCVRVTAGVEIKVWVGILNQDSMGALVFVTMSTSHSLGLLPRCSNIAED